MKLTEKIKNNEGMSITELVMASLMLTAFTSVFIVVSRFTAKFLQPINIDGARNYELAKDISIKENEMADIFNDNFKINFAI